MKSQSLLKFFTLRVIIGALGEISQPPWWTTAFLAQTSQMFLTPVFTKTYQLAQYHGSRETAARLHDEFIGVGKVYHLFRLPEILEYELQNFAIKQPSETKNLFQNAASVEVLLSQLIDLAGNNKKSPSIINGGPIRVGSVEELTKSTAIENLAQYYLAGFQEKQKVYPYFADENQKQNIT